MKNYMKHFTVGLLPCVVAVAAMVAVSAGSALADTIVVDNDGFGDGVGGCHGIEAIPSTIQAGIDAAMDGDTVAVCPGAYVEDLEITTDNLTIAAVSSKNRRTVIQGVAVSTGPFPNCGTAPGVGGPSLANINISATGTTITGFTIKSPAVADSGEYTCGLIFDGANTRIVNNVFKTSSGDPGSVAIQTWFETNGPLGTIDGSQIIGNEFKSSAKALAPQLGYEAIFINSQTEPVGSAVTIAENEFDGDMYRAIAVARDGVNVFGNKIETSIDTIAVDTPTFGTVPLGIRIFNGNCNVVGNDIESRKHRKSWKHKNRFDKGIKVSETATGCVFYRNEIENSATLDCEDLSTGGGTAGTANLWLNNEGKSAEPAGICNRKRHDHKSHDHKRHDHKSHGHKRHDHKRHDHKRHDHKRHDHDDD